MKKILLYISKKVKVYSPERYKMIISMVQGELMNQGAICLPGLAVIL